MKAKSQQYDGPVPMKDHYALFNETEGKFREYLNDQQQEYLLIGLRVAYDVLESSISEPGVFPYSVEFGSFIEEDQNIDCVKENSEKEFEQIARRFPIPVEMMEESYKSIREKLQSLAGKELSVGLFLQVKTSMTIKSGSVTCYCNKKPNNRVVKASGGAICRKGC